MIPYSLVSSGVVLASTICTTEDSFTRDSLASSLITVADFSVTVTGISSSYEEPKDSHIVIDTEKLDIETSLHQLYTFLKERI